MRALVLPQAGAGRVECRPNHPDPRPAPGEVLIRVSLAGICATDLELARGYMGFAGVPGHEFVGVVVQANDQAHQSGELLGRRVVGEINCPCGTCELCRRGLGNHCPQRTVLGIAGRDGAFAEYLTLPAANCHVVPDHVSDRAAVFAEPLAAAVHVLDAVALTPQTRVAVLGTGRLGLLVAQFLAQQRCELDVFGRNPRSLALCAGWKLRTQPADAAAAQRAPDNPGRYDVVVECTGVPAGLALALRLCRPRGTVILKSTYAEPAPIELAPAVINEVNIVGSRCGDFRPALRLLAEGRIATEELISAVYPLEQGPAALAAADEPESIKVLLKP